MPIVVDPDLAVVEKLRAALRSYRRAARINPHLEGVRQAIESLEKILGEEGKK